MTGRNWQPGDVAMARHERSFADDFLVVRTGLSSESYWSAPRDWPDGISSEDCIYRPLVVIDPEDREQVERLLRCHPWHGWGEAGVDDMQQALRDFAAPKPSCSSHINVKGEHFACELDAPHPGLAHSNKAAEAIWGEPA